MSELIERFELIRGKLRLNKGEMASKLGITANTFTNYIQGERPIPTYIIIKLFNDFDVNPTWFFNGQDEMFLKNIECVNKNDIQVKSYNELLSRRTKNLSLKDEDG